MDNRADHVLNPDHINNPLNAPDRADHEPGVNDDPDVSLLVCSCGWQQDSDLEPWSAHVRLATPDRADLPLGEREYPDLRAVLVHALGEAEVIDGEVWTLEDAADAILPFILAIEKATPDRADPERKLTDVERRARMAWRIAGSFDDGPVTPDTDRDPNMDYERRDAMLDVAFRSPDPPLGEREYPVCPCANCNLERGHDATPAAPDL